MITDLLSKIHRVLIDLKTRPNIQAIALLAFWSLASRGLGALRILLVGQMTTQEADIFNAAFVLPDNIIAIFILGSITLAVLPYIVELHHTEKQNQTQDQSDTDTSQIANAKEAVYLTHVTLYLSLFIGVMTVLALIFTAPLLQVLNPNLRTNLIQINKWQEYLNLTQVLLLAPLIFALKTIFGSFLNARREFGIYALDGIFTNIGILFGLTLFYYYFGVIGAVWGVVLGFSISCIAFGIDAYKHGLRFRLKTFDGLDEYLRKTVILYLPRLLVIPAIRIAETMVTLTASAADGEITVLRTALDLQGIPLGMVAVAAVVFLPDITDIYVKSGFGDELKQLLKKYLHYGALFSILGAIGVTVGAPIGFWVLGQLGFIRTGSFFDSTENIRLIVLCTGITSISLVFQTIAEFYNRVYVAIKNATIPLISSLAGNIIGVIVIFMIAPQFGAALATAIGFSVNSIVQSIIVVYFLAFVTRQPLAKTPPAHQQ